MRVLVVEQSEVLRDSFANTLSVAGFEVQSAKTIPEAAQKFATHTPEIVVLDLLLLAGDPLLFMAGILGAMPNTRIIGTTASGAMRLVGIAIDAGAFDYLVKPIAPEAMIAKVQNAAVVTLAPQQIPLDMAKSAKHAAVFGSKLDIIRRMAPSHVPVLIEGEAGTGKRICAEAMHAYSHRANLPFVTVKCDELANQDFGAVFTEPLLANGGTLYLAEPSHLPLIQQTQLLRFLQSAVLDIIVSGSNLFNIRVICGMSTLAEDAVDAGRMREDLFYRLKAVRISLAPLRTRAEEIPDIANTFLRMGAERNQKPLTKLAEDAGNALSKMAWPGNIAQLQSVLSRCLQTQTGKILKLDMLPETVLAEIANEGIDPHHLGAHFRAEDAENTVVDLVRAGWSLADLERLLIETAVAQNNGSLPKAAAHLNVSPSTLYRKKENWN